MLSKWTVIVDTDGLRWNFLHSWSPTLLFASHFSCPIIELVNYILNSQFQAVQDIKYHFEEYLSLCRLYFVKTNESFCWLTIVYTEQTHSHLFSVTDVCCFVNYDAEPLSFFHSFGYVLQHNVRCNLQNIILNLLTAFGDMLLDVILICKQATGYLYIEDAEVKSSFHNSYLTAVHC